MIFFINFIYAFLTPIFLFFIMFKVFCNNKSRIRLVYILLFSSVFVGALIQKVAVIFLYDRESLVVFQSLSLFAWLVFFIFLLFKKTKFFAFCFLGVFLFLLAGASYIDSIKNLSFSVANIINSDFIINISYVFLAIVLISIFALLTKKLSLVLNKTVFYTSFIIVFCLNLLSLIGEIMLYGIKNDFIEMTSFNLSFVAKATYFDFLYFYVYLALLLFFTFLYFQKRTKFEEGLNIIKSRKLKKLIQVQSRLIGLGLFTPLLIAGLLAYYDLYASQPPKISDAVILEPNENDEFVIPIKDVIDGDLYRYAYITEDGHKARFFLINRYPDREKVVAVFDACMICGDQGYIKEGNDIICIACNVRIFTPSIGKAGGCNPIPLEFTKKDGNVIIKKSTIIEGARYFSEVVSIEVEDVISKAKLINTEAKFSYEYNGKTFYFENEENMKKFRQSPETYASKIIKRRWRTQGHKESK